MKVTKSQRNNILTVGIILLLIIPQTRKPIQIGINKIFTLFSPSVVSKEDRKILANYNWELVSNKNENFNLNEVKEKVVFINLWATWCPPCIAEMPNIHKLYNDYKGKVAFLFVSNEDAKRVNAFFKRKGYDFPSYRPVGEIPEELFSKSIPATYILNKKGEMVIDKKGAANWNSSSIRSLLDSLLLE